MHPMLNIAVKAARRAGSIIERAAVSGVTLDVRAKRANDFVTQVDRAAEQAVIDMVRKAYPDQIVLRPDTNIAAVTNDIIQDQGAAASSILLDADVASNFVQQVVNDPDLSKRTVIGPSGIVRYFAVNTQRIPRLECRQALAYGLIAANVVSLIVLSQLPAQKLEPYVAKRGFVPARVAQLFNPNLVVQVHLSDAALPAPLGLRAAQGLLQPVVRLTPNRGEILLSLFTAMFIHGGWLHLLSNMWYLWIFGDNIEDRLGHALDGVDVRIASHGSPRS